MTTRPVKSLIDEQLEDLIMPAQASIPEALGIPYSTPVANLPQRMALTIQGGRKRLEVRHG